MAEVKWNARRVSDGVLVDVTADISGTVLPIPSQNAIEGGGGGAALTVDNGDTEETVAKIIAPGADLSTPGEATINSPWTVNEEGGLSADLTEYDPLVGNALSLTMPGGDAWFNINGLGVWDVVVDPAAPGGAPVFRITAPNSVHRFTVTDDGDGGSFEVRPEGNVVIVPTAAATRVLQVYDTAGNEALRVDADGTVHIKTGGSIIADLP